MNSVLHLERMFYKNTETFIINQVKSIKKYKVDVACITALKNGENINQLISPPINNHLFRTKILNTSDQQYLIRKIQSNCYSLIHSHFLSDASFFYNVSKNIKSPKVVSAYGYDVSEFPTRYLGLGKKYLTRMFDEYNLVLAMSEDMKNDLLNIGCPEDKIKIHYHGIDTALFFNNNRTYLEKDMYNLLSVGTICEKKGQHLVIEALNILINRYNVKNILYHIVGVGPYTDLIRKKIIDYKLAPYVIMHGHLSHSDGLVTYYNSADIFIHACKKDNHNAKEGIPGVIVEAMSNGLPVISTNHAGIPSIISNKKSGILIDENNVEQIVDSILLLINSSFIREKIGKSAQSYAIQNLDMYAKIQYLENNIYEDLITNYKY